MSDLIIRDKRGYARRRPQAHPYVKPGIWPNLGALLLDVGLALLFWVGIIAGLYWLWTR